MTTRRDRLIIKDLEEHHSMIYEGMAKRPIHPGYERRTYNFAVRPPVTWVGEETLTKLRLLGNIIAIDMKYRSIKVSGAYRQSKKSAAGE